MLLVPRTIPDARGSPKHSIDSKPKRDVHRADTVLTGTRARHPTRTRSRASGRRSNVDRDADAADGMHEKRMGDSSISKIESRYSLRGERAKCISPRGNRCRCSCGKSILASRRRATAPEYETVGYVIKGRAELESEGDNGSEEAARTRALLDAYHRPGRPLTRARRRIP